MLRRIAVWAMFLVLPFAVLWRIVPGISRLTIGNDYTVYPLDGQLELMWAWSKGMFPLYIPGFDGGNTIAAMTLSQAWHPITWICGLFPSFRTGSAEILLTLFRLLELGFTHAIVYRATRDSGLRRTSSFVLSFVIVYNGRMLDSFRYGPSLEGYCGMLFACAAFFSGFRRGWSVGRISLAAIAIYLTLVSGHPQWALFATTGAGLFALCLPLAAPQLAAPERGGPWWKFFAGVGAACVGGVVLSAGYLLPFLREFMPQNGDRVNQDYKFTLGYGDTVRGVVSNFVRPLESDVHGAFGGGALYLALVLTLPVLLVTRRRFAYGAVGPAILLAIAILFALGDATPVHRFMVEHLPLFSSFRTPGRATLWIPPMMLLLGWLTLADLDRPEVARAWMRVPAIAVGGVLAFAALVVSHFALYGQRVGDNTPGALMKMPGLVPALVFSSLGLGAAMLVFLAVRARATRAVAWTVLIGSTVLGAAATLPFGTWVADRKPSRNVDDIDARHRRNYAFVGDAGFGLGTRLVSKAEAEKIPVRRELATVAEKAVFVSTNDAAVEAVKRGGLPATTVVLTMPETALPTAQAGGASRALPTFINWNRWVFHVNAPRGGIFVFGQPAMNEWRATVDGKSAEVHTANAVFAAVVLEPGEHDVEFRYASPSTKLGAALFFGGFAVLVALNGILRGMRRANLRPRVAWWAAAALTVGLIGLAAMIFFRRLDPPFNILEAPAKTAAVDAK